MFKQEEMLQPEIYERQENRSKSGKIGGRCSNRKGLRIKRIGGKIVKQEKNSN